MFLGIENFWSMAQGSLNLHILQWQTVVFHALHVRMLFPFLYISWPFSSFRRQEMTWVFLWTTWGLNDMQFVFLYPSIIPEHLEHILPAWLVIIEKLFQKHEVAFSYDFLGLIDVVFSYIKRPKIYFGADRVRRGVRWFGMKSEYLLQGKHT